MASYDLDELVDAIFDGDKRTAYNLLREGHRSLPAYDAALRHHEARRKPEPAMSAEDRAALEGRQARIHDRCQREHSAAWAVIAAAHKDSRARFAERQRKARR